MCPPDYHVTVNGCDPIPVRAANSSAARNHAVRQKVKVEPLTTEQAIEFGRKGIDLQIAGEDLVEAKSETELNEGK